MWYVIIGLAVLFIALGLVHSHNAKVEPPANDNKNNDDEYSYRIHSHGRGKED